MFISAVLIVSINTFFMTAITKPRFIVDQSLNSNGSYYIYNRPFIIMAVTIFVMAFRPSTCILVPI
jgi:hypothetical protein